MLRATLWPLVALMIAVGAIVLLVSRELMRSARRLEVALEQARAADRTKTEFLSNVSHELRTPLNGIIGIAQLLQMREQEPESRHMLDILLASAHSQLQLVNGLLDITRIESGVDDARAGAVRPGRGARRHGAADRAGDRGEAARAAARDRARRRGGRWSATRWPSGRSRPT